MLLLPYIRRTLLIGCAVGIGLVYVSCMGSPETSFFSNFSTRKLVEHNKPAVAASCDPMAGGGGGVGGRVGGFGSGGAHLNSHRSDSCGCRLKSNELVDEAALFNALKLDVEQALHNNGATISASGSSGAANFYFVYTLKDVRGRVELTGNRIGAEYYNVRADLNETRN